MSRVVIVKANEIDPGMTTPGGLIFRPAAKRLGIQAWGMSLIELAPHCEDYPEHDHADDGQHEAYFVVAGTAVLRTPEGQHEVEAGHLIGVPAGVRRHFQPGLDGCTILAIGRGDA